LNDDLTAFVDALKFTGFFDSHAPVVLSRAPGRLDVMGGIADYSGSLVLQRTTAEATFAAVQRTDQALLNIVSLSLDSNGVPRVFALPLEALLKDGWPIRYTEARRFFSNETDSWAAYVVGVFVALMRERGVVFTEGAKILISSRVPEGKGVASSAALEVATMQSVASAFGILISAKDMAILCQIAENMVAGAPCGVMDQMTSACGESDSLLALLCQPAELQAPVLIPGEIAFWGVDSGERHAVRGSDYTSVRTAAFMGHRILDLSDDDSSGGYLANVTPVKFAREVVSLLPDQMTGAEFLTRYSGTSDSVTTIDPSRTYSIRQATAHPVFENDRVHEFRRLLMSSPGEAQRVRLGELMLQSHESYSACGLGAHGTDLIVKLVREAGANGGLYGARITGGGSGGTVAILGRADAGNRIAEIVAKYRSLTGYSPHVFSGSSPGAAQFGTRTVTI
jgi:L-arabinokinase